MLVRIRPYETDDIPRAFEAAKQSYVELSPFMPWCHADYSIEETRSWITERIAAFAARTDYCFAVVSGDDGTLLGGCGPSGIDTANRRANLGYWIRTDATRRGAATTATRLLADWAFEHTALARLEIVTAIDNAASRRVAEKVGAFREGVARSRLLLRGAMHDAVIFSIVRG
ncbi:MAG TPA: GNAT family N-acetyltransferase [Polyangiaceae bacterium]|nr:GNAT family N-acetyltransferase [Polyangiaceae bacterium]